MSSNQILEPIPGRFLKRWKVFANGGTLIDDLSFSYYFHQSGINQLFHFVSTMIIYVSIIILLSAIYSPNNIPILAITLFVPYAIMMIVLEFMCGLLYSTWFTLWLIISPYLLHEKDNQLIPIICLVFLVVFPLLQLLGHVLIERRMPGFRVFEIIFTTPIFLMIRLLVVLGFMTNIWEVIKIKSSQWISWKHHTFCDGQAARPIVI
jgi:uncharacterized membrane protein YGL010W